MVRVFNHWFSPRKAAYFFAEETVLVIALLAGASLGPVAAQATSAVGGPPMYPAVLRAALASVFFAGALYLGDLYDLHAAVRDRADGRRLLRAIGVAAIAIALADVALDLFLPGWMLHRSLVLAAAGGAFGVIAARVLMPAVVGSPTRVVFLGTGTRARDLARAMEREADGLYRAVGFVQPERSLTPAAVSPEAILEGTLKEVVRRERAQFVVVAMEDRREGLPIDDLLSLRTRGRRVVEVTRRVVRGTLEAITGVLSRTGTGRGIHTAYIERLNATFRSNLTGLVRRGRALWRQEGRVQAAMYLVGCAYNWCWERDSLRVAGPAGGRKWAGRTPAMAAGLTDHAWSLEELLRRRVPPAVWKAPRRRPRRRRAQVPPAPLASAA